MTVSGNLHLAWCRLLARSFALAGVSDVVISPGSRSTPLVLGFEAEEEIEKHTILDERSAAFFALGMARASGVLVALVCTSGTAGAHYFPAILEASQARVPLLVLTTDRPWEDHHCGASQTMDQGKLFGSHVRHFAELGLPDVEALQAVPRIAAQAAAATMYPDPGPVHLNICFRKPLEPVDAPRPEPHEAEVERLLSAGIPLAYAPEIQPSPTGIRRLAALCARVRRGLVVAGPAPWSQIHLVPEVLRLSAALGYPICAETSSQLRQGSCSPFCIPSFDLLFRSQGFLERHRPELILELGMAPVSGAYGAWLSLRSCVPRVVIAPHGWNDPHGNAAMMLFSPVGEAIRALLTSLTSQRLPVHPEPGWVEAWAEGQRVVEDQFASELSERQLTEAVVARMVASAIPPGATLLVGNSGPIRDLDQHGGMLARDVRVVHQRGVAGIDGWVAAAAGARAATEGPVVLLLGDIALLHDIGSLQLIRDDGPLVIVVINNNGGRIFEQLPLARCAEVAEAFQQHFLTPHGLTFGAFATAWGLRYACASSPAFLREAMSEALAYPSPMLVEAVIDPVESARRRTAFWSALAPRLEAIP
ncbi:MAG: 2-succinyl-5-enolpyruvyl-6-hydroxy-3-cyclohexene-1-carboxylic-acid synthase [Myxococcales bacterium]|nr:2-succinyl-5-enolpyruvyl-6-hydroxy-3-cyclohexene-1-carboxylic-acid synthase [Polyangiaceae bacterium]MDW8247723.1 2-succinyl-5-enolpyruvyl-6-hydroxy-3-cyclohexene-1-carboxylic-acid synthase [Myxococcales bacterium]